MAQWRLGVVASGVLWLAASPAAAQADEQLARDDRIAELERKVEVLTEELDRTRSEIAVPELPELKSHYGMGPAASKIYDATRGLSIGGYAEGFYRKLVEDSGGAKDSADWLRMVLYAGYKFSDRILFNTELEWEHATSSATESAGAGSISVEFATLDFMWRDEANARAGLVLVPMGFLNEVHEPPFFHGVNRPEVEREIIPSTWRENGVGLFGSLWGESVDYKAYVVNGFNAAGFSASGLRGGRQNGNRALAEHPAFVGKLEGSPLPGLLLGGSLYLGNSGQNQKLASVAPAPPGTLKVPDTFSVLWELHSEFRMYNAAFRTLFTMAHLDEAAALTAALRASGDIGATEVVADEMLGVYAEVAYDVWRLFFPESERSLEPFFRFEYLDTQHDVPSGFAADDSERVRIYTAGLSFKPIPNVVLKADYRNLDPEAGSLADELNLGVGVAF